MRVCIEIATGRLIEAQSNDAAPLYALEANAVAAGYAPSEVETKVVSDEEYRALLCASPTLEQVKAQKIREIATACDAALEPLAARFSTLERQTWERQLAEAKALRDNPTLAAPPVDNRPDPIPTIRGITAVTGEDPIAFAGIILDNDAAWTTLVSNAIGQRQALCDRINAAVTVAEVLAVPLAITLPE